jgi:D-sedoheptulose 7-phosphate isomerase
MDLPTFARAYLEDLSCLLRDVDAAAIGKAINWLREARDAGRTIYSCGNGGSALIASQMVCDIVKGGSYQHPKRIKMICLSDNMGTVLAYANDVSYESVFVEPLRNFAVKDDVLIGISGSGNSPNVLRAVEYAHQIGCRTIGLTTAKGGKLKDLVQLPLLVPSNHMGRLEDVFFAITHMLCYAFIEKVAQTD